MDPDDQIINQFNSDLALASNPRNLLSAILPLPANSISQHDIWSTVDLAKPVFITIVSLSRANYVAKYPAFSSAVISRFRVFTGIPGSQGKAPLSLHSKN
jgi:hypothetical protein